MDGRETGCCGYGTERRRNNSFRRLCQARGVRLSSWRRNAPCPLPTGLRRSAVWPSFYITTLIDRTEVCVASRMLSGAWSRSPRCGLPRRIGVFVPVLCTDQAKSGSEWRDVSDGSGCRTSSRSHGISGRSERAICPAATLSRSRETTLSTPGDTLLWSA